MQEKRSRLLPLLATSHALNHLYQLLAPVIAPELIIEFGESSAGLFLWCFLLSYSLLPIVSGHLTQRFGRRNVLVSGFAASAFCFIAIGFTSNIAVLALLFLTAGAAGSTYHPSGFPILAEAYPTNRGQTLGLHQTGGAVGSILGPIVTGLMVVSFAWRSTMMLMAIPGLVISGILWFSIDPRRTPSDTASQSAGRISLRDLRMYSPAVFLIAAAVFYQLGLRGTDAFAQIYFTNGRGVEIIEASFLFSALKVSGLFSAPISGKLSDKFGRKKILIALVIIESASLYAITALPAMLLVFPCVIFGFGAFGLLAVGEALLADITPEKQRAAIFGLNLTISFSPYIFLTPALFAMSSLYGFNTGFVILSILMPISIPLILKIRNKSSKASKSARD